MMIVMAFLSFLCMADLHAQAKSMYGGKINLNGNFGADNTLGMYLAGEAGMGILSGPTITDNKPIWFLGGYIGPSIALNGDIQVNIAGGYEQNLTYERGQYGALLGLSGESWSIEGTKLWPTNPVYRAKYSNFVLSGSWYPENTIGFGVFYQKEYECSYVGIKLSLRVTGRGTSRSSGSFLNCWGYWFSSNNRIRICSLFIGLHFFYISSVSSEVRIGFL